MSFEGVRAPLTLAYPLRECTAVRLPKPRDGGRRSWRSPETHAKSKTDSRYGDFRPLQGPLLVASRYAFYYIRVAFLEVPETTFFLSKFKNDLRHGGICCSRRRVKMASRKRQPRDGANFAPSHFFAKKRKIDGFPSLILPKTCDKRECRRAKMASRM